MSIRLWVFAVCLGGSVVPCCEAQLAPIVIKPKPSSTGDPARSTPNKQRPAPNIPQPAESNTDVASIDTILEIDILSPGLIGDPSAQHWGKVFEELGASVRIRNGRDLKAEVTEKVRGSLRFVHASGVLNREGELSFGTESFRLEDSERLKSWIDELKTYGAQGTPAGKLLWGLSKAQFTIVYEQLAKPLPVDARGRSITDLMGELQDKSELAIRWSTESQTWLAEGNRDRPLTQNLEGFSTGTGLAIALNEVDMGMRPLRTPAGTIVYELLPLGELPDPWPMGWEPEAALPRGELTPNLFKKGRVGFEEVPLAEVLESIAVESKTPIVIDTRRSLARKIDVTQKTVSYAPREIAWALVVSQVARQSGLYNYYRQDETGRGFVLIAPFEIKTTPKE